MLSLAREPAVNIKFKRASPMERKTESGSMETPPPQPTATEPPPAVAQPPSPPTAATQQPPQQSPQPSSIPSTPEANPPSSSSSSAPSSSQSPTPLQPQQDQQPPPAQFQTQTPAQTQTQTQTPAQTQTVQQQQRPALSVTRPQPPYTPLPSAMQRGGLAIGVPAHSPHHPRSHQPFSAYGPSQAFGQSFGGIPRPSSSVPEPSPSSNTQGRQPVQGIQTIGMIGSLSSGSQLRPSGIPPQYQPRPGQPPLRPASPSTNQTISTQKFPSHGLARGPSMASPSSSSPGPQSAQPSHHQLIGAQGKQIHGAPLASSSYRSQMRPQVMQQRPNLPQQHQLMPSTNLQQMSSSQQQQQHHKQQQQQKHQQLPLQQAQISQPHHAQEHHSQQHTPSRNQQSLPQQQPVRGLGSATQKSNVQASILPGAIQPGPVSPIVTTDATEYANQILSKRSIRELVAQIDPLEKLDPEVEDVLVEIADDFIESVTTFACSLAKHRKSTTLEAKDILLHVERNWNMTLPGFGGDEIKCYKKPFTNDIHKERLAVIKKSMAGASDTGSAKNPAAGQAAANPRGHAAKTPAIGSPKT